MLYNMLITMALISISILLCKLFVLFTSFIINHIETKASGNMKGFIEEMADDKYQSSANNFLVILAIFIIASTSIYFNFIYLLPGFLLLMCGIIDFESGYLPEELTTLLLWSALILSVFGLVAIPIKESLLGAVSGFSFIFGLDFLLRATKKGAFGSGDAPFLAAIGAWSGPLMVPLVFSLALLGHPKDGARKPFGHRLAMAGWLCILLKLIARTI